MADNPQPQPAPEPTPEPTPAPTPAPEPEFQPVTSQEQFDRMTKDRIARERAKFADYDDLKKRADKLAEIEAANQSELEKAQARADAAEKTSEQTAEKAKEALLRAAVIAEAAKKNVIDPDAAFALLDRSTIEFDEDGNPKNIDKAMDSLLEARPFLVAADNGGARPGGADQGARGGGDKQVTDDELKSMSPDEINKARREGRLDSLLGVSK